MKHRKFYIFIYFIL